MTADSEANPDFTADELRTLLESLEYSIMNVRDAQGTPYEVRQENLSRLRDLKAKIGQLLRNRN